MLLCKKRPMLARLTHHFIEGNFVQDGESFCIKKPVKRRVFFNEIAPKLLNLRRQMLQVGAVSS